MIRVGGATWQGPVYPCWSIGCNESATNHCVALCVIVFCNTPAAPLHFNGSQHILRRVWQNQVEIRSLDSDSFHSARESHEGRDMSCPVTIRESGANKRLLYHYITSTASLTPFLSDPGIPGPIFVSGSLKQTN